MTDQRPAATLTAPPEAGEEETSLTVRVESFEGPLDLLLHLVRTQEIDLARIPVGKITDQYLTYLRAMDFRDLDIAGSFMVMAATLIYLKSKLLLPQEPSGEADELLDEEGDELRRQLEERLRAYARFKAIGQVLGELEEAQSRLFSRTVHDLPDWQTLAWAEEISLYDVMEAYRQFCLRLARLEPVREIEPSHPSLLERMDEILILLQHTWYLLFSAIVGERQARSESVVTLLALLELVRLQHIQAEQREPFGDIVIHRPLERE